MTESTQCGWQIHMAANALRAVRNTALEKNGIAFELWVGMEAVAEIPGMTREKLIDRLTRMTVHDGASAAEAIDRLHRQRLITADDQGVIELTTRGKALADKVIATRSELRTQLYGGIPTDDIATTKRVLDTIRERAAAVHVRQ